MCGLFGYDFKEDTISHGRRSLLGAALARLNDRRGGDSWGMFTPVGETFKIKKGLGDFKDRAYELLDHHTIMGHCRFKTQGSITIANCHPFEIGQIIGSHNGCLANHEELNKKYKREFEVDSMHIFAHLDAGLKLKDLVGYGAITWVNRKDLRTINLCRLHGGSLSVAGIGKKGNTKGVVWSSSEDHLKAALKSAGIHNYFFYKIEKGRIYQVCAGELIVLKSKSLELTAEDKKPVTYASGYSQSSYYSSPPNYGPKIHNMKQVADNTYIFDNDEDDVVLTDEEEAFFKTLEEQDENENSLPWFRGEQAEKMVSHKWHREPERYTDGNRLNRVDTTDFATWNKVNDEYKRDHNK